MSRLSIWDCKTDADFAEWKKQNEKKNAKIMIVLVALVILMLIGVSFLGRSVEKRALAAQTACEEQGGVYVATRDRDYCIRADALINDAR